MIVKNFFSYIVVAISFVSITQSSLAYCADVDLPIVQIRQEKNLCVPTSTAMVLEFYGKHFSPREIKTWAAGKEYDPEKPFNDFSQTIFNALIAGLNKHGIIWQKHIYSNDQTGFETGYKEILQQLDAKHPVLMDTTLLAGHTFVISGYKDDGATLLVVDPYIDPPGRREFKKSELAEIWNSSKTGAKNRAVIFTSSP